MVQNKNNYKKIIILGIFAIAMAFLESSVVIYLRKLYYPNGFNFPLNPFIEPYLIATEVLREISTIVMLVVIAILSGKNFTERLVYFVYGFGIWDIFYYIWLKVLLDWPSSLFTFDVLFLIPWPWVAPVMVPIIISLSMIILAINIIFQKIKINTKECILLTLGALIVLYTFLYDYGKLIFKKESSYNYIPQDYNWVLFFVGEIFIVAAIIIYYFRTKKIISKLKIVRFK